LLPLTVPLISLAVLSIYYILNSLNVLIKIIYLRKLYHTVSTSVFKKIHYFDIFEEAALNVLLLLPDMISRCFS